MELFKSVAFCAALALSSLAHAASTLETLYAHVPFAFMLAGHEFSPGMYEIHENSDGTILVTGNGQAAFVVSYPFDSSAPGSLTRLRFTSDGVRSYLTTVEGEDVIRAIPVHIHEEGKTSLSH